MLAALLSLSTQLSAAQLGITVTNLTIGYLAEPSIARAIDGPLASIGLPSGSVTGVAAAIAIVIATTVTMVFGELVPKNLAIAQPLATARSVQGLLRGFSRATRWIVSFFNGTANAILRRIGIEPQEELASARSAEELASLVGRSAAEGTLEAGTATLLQRSLAFGERRAVDVMTPRVQMHALRDDAPVLDVLREARATGRSRFPVLASGTGRVVGIVHVKHAISVPHEHRAAVPIRDVMARPVLVPAAIELDPLLALLRQGGLQMAIVIDEFGDVDGIVTLEDLIEEIVGSVRDEHDDADDDPVRRAPDGSWLLSGLLRPDEVARATGVHLPEDEHYETLGGLLPAHLERMPEVGDTVEVGATDADRASIVAELTVVALDDLRVDKVRLAVRRPGPEADA